MGRLERASLALAIVVAGCSATSAGSGAPVASADPRATASAPTCRGVRTDWTEVPEPVRSYGLAWNERDPAQRLEHLATAFASEGRFVDRWLPGPIVGRGSLDRRIADFHPGRDGQYFEFRDWTNDNILAGRARIPWRLCDGDGSTLLIGTDFGVVDADGRLVDVASFEIAALGGDG